MPRYCNTLLDAVSEGDIHRNSETVDRRETKERKDGKERREGEETKLLSVINSVDEIDGELNVTHLDDRLGNSLSFIFNSF